MTGRHVALLRGVNVGRARRIAMADLRSLVEGLGYTDVTTVLNSGNVVFTAPAAVRGDPARRIAQALVREMDVRSRVTVLTRRELDAIVSHNPLATVADNPSRLLVDVLADPADRRKLEPLTRQDWAPEALALGTRAAYVWCPGGVIRSPLSRALDRVLGDAVTARNWNTMLKLHTIAHHAS